MDVNQNNSYPSPEGYEGQFTPSVTLGRYTAKTFLWMFLGLLVTFGVSIFLYESMLVALVYVNPYIPMVLAIVEVGVVIFLSARIHKLSIGAARGLFFFYAALNGVTFSALFVVFEVPSLVLVFAATALYFGGMAVFGYVTRVDLSRLRNLLFAGLIFLVVFWVLSMFIPGLAVFDRIVCLIGVVIFLAYTAYDTQKIKANYQAYMGDSVMLKKASVISALQLYLDFVNLFVYLLRILGRRK